MASTSDMERVNGVNNIVEYLVFKVCVKESRSFTLYLDQDRNESFVVGIISEHLLSAEESTTIGANRLYLILGRIDIIRSNQLYNYRHMMLLIKRMLLRYKIDWIKVHVLRAGQVLSKWLMEVVINAGIEIEDNR